VSVQPLPEPSHRALSLVGQQLALFSADEARRLTDEVKADAAALWTKLLRLYEGGAHTALGYSSWADYCAAEFEMGRDYSYKLLASARVVAVLRESTIVDSQPSSEAVARELAPLRDEPEQMREAWQDAVDEHGPEPTAAQTRGVVKRRQSPANRRQSPANNDVPRSEQTDDEGVVRALAEQAALNDYSRAVDGMTQALSYAKTWTPPAEIPENYPPISEFISRARTLLEIVEAWR
jgi:hypothetical protein